ncbi:hypothetical protein [Flavobacterium sp. 3HN19-14]|uniref:hypothetical protein n=1 Tax=Flavobacterium sp. 3HN19-14 TaxID=3448133 RepID=UPI003EE24017
MLGIGTFTYFNYSNTPSEDLGTYDTPEEAFAATQKALSLVSSNVNAGVKGVQYLNEYEAARSKVFN